jgi:hypothetical protein
MGSRVENRRNGFSLPVAIGMLSHDRRNPVWLGPVSCSRSSNRTGSFPASGSRKRLTRSPTEGSRSGVVTGPSHTQSSETPPENVCMPAAALCVCRITTDAAFCGRAYQPHLGFADWPQTEVVGPTDHHPIEPVHDGLRILPDFVASGFVADRSTDALHSCLRRCRA